MEVAYRLFYSSSQEFAVRLSIFVVLFPLVPVFVFADEQAKTVEEAMERMSALVEIADKKLATAENKHQVAIDEIEQQAIGWLVTIARTHAGSGRIAEASKTYAKVLEIDLENPVARKFFEAIGRLDEIEKEIAEGKENFSPEVKEKRPALKKVEWRRTDQKESQHRFVRLPNGLWQEISSDGKPQSLLVVVAQFPDLVELRDRTGKLMVRIHDSAFYYSSDGKNWKSGALGRWVK
ncbi:MAG: hypothetical protein R3C05_15050 [Pirellulaceae bacterium]